MSTKLMGFFKKNPAATDAKSPRGEPLAKPVVLKAVELLAAINEARPKALKGLPEKQALAVISAVLNALGDKIDAAGDTPVRVTGLGVFRSRDVERKVDGGVKRVRSVGFRRVAAAARKSSGA